MIQNFKKGLVLISAFLLSVMAPAMAIPQNVQLITESTINENGQKIVINSKIWYGNKKIRMENEIVPIKGIPEGMNKSNMILDTSSNTAYLMMPMNKTAIKVDSSMMSKMQGGQGSGNMTTQMLSDPSEMLTQIKKNGGKMIGAETILGHLCDIWQIQTDIPNQNQVKENATVKIWLAHKLFIPLKMEMNSAKRGKFMTIYSKDIKSGVSMPSSLFEVPKDYQVTDMQQMMNQVQNQVKNKKIK